MCAHHDSKNDGLAPESRSAEADLAQGPVPIDALERLGMVEGLGPQEVDRRIALFARRRDIDGRMLGFYLLEMEERNLHQTHWGRSTLLRYAKDRHGMGKRRVNELVHAAKQLRLLTRIDQAFCDQEISWSKVLLLVRIVEPPWEKAWLEKAKELSVEDLKGAARMRRQDGSPRLVGDTKALPSIFSYERFRLDGALRGKLDKVREKMEAELGRPVQGEEILDVLTSIHLGSEFDPKTYRFEFVSADLYTVMLRPWVESQDPEAPLFVMTDDGPMPLHGSAEADVTKRQLSKMILSDAEILDADGSWWKDDKTSAAKRRRTLKRDGTTCRCCGRTHKASELHVHHIVWRSKGGRTKMQNLITVCIRCHALIHEGLITIDRPKQGGAQFLDPQGDVIACPKQLADPEAILKIEPPKVRPVLLDDRAMEELEGEAKTGRSRPKWTTLDAVPKTVNATWWRKNAHLMKAQGARGLELRPGVAEASAAADPEPVEGEPVDEALSFDEAFGGIVGRDALLVSIRDEIQAAETLAEPFPHTLFSGPAGTGKTTFARGIAGVLGTELHATQGPDIQDVHQVVSLLASLGKDDVLFLDEIHRVPHAVLEVLYEAMDGRRVALTLRTGARTKTVSLEVEPFTLIAATTHPGDLPEPLKTRFALREFLSVLSDEDLAVLAKGSAAKLGIELDDEAAALLADRARGVPRTLRILVDRVRRLAAVRAWTKIDASKAKVALHRAGFDDEGLNPEERLYLDLLRGARGPTAVQVLSDQTGIDIKTVMRSLEPWLIRKGVMRRTPGGRVATPRLVAEARSPRMGKA